MPHCLRLMADGSQSQLWLFTDDEAVLLGVTNPEGGAPAPFTSSTGKVLVMVTCLAISGAKSALACGAVRVHCLQAL